MHCDYVEAEVCQECGERYYHATTLDAIDHNTEDGQARLERDLTDLFEVKGVRPVRLGLRFGFRFLRLVQLAGL